MQFPFSPCWAILAARNQEVRDAPMKRFLAALLTALLVVVMTLASVFVLVGASLALAKISSPLLQAVAVAAELVLGVLLLVGTVYLGTHVAVRIFAPKSPPWPNPHR